MPPSSTAAGFVGATVSTRAPFVQTAADTPPPLPRLRTQARYVVPCVRLSAVAVYEVTFPRLRHFTMAVVVQFVLLVAVVKQMS
jgi:hypothetical protein